MAVRSGPLASCRTVAVLRQVGREAAAEGWVTSAEGPAPPRIDRWFRNPFLAHLDHRGEPWCRHDHEAGESFWTRFVKC